MKAYPRSDNIARNAFRVRVSGLTERRYGMYYFEVSTNSLRYLATRRTLTWDIKPESVDATFNPKNLRPNLVHIGV